MEEVAIPIKDNNLPNHIKNVTEQSKLQQKEEQLKQAIEEERYEDAARNS